MPTTVLWCPTKAPISPPLTVQVSRLYGRPVSPTRQASFTGPLEEVFHEIPEAPISPMAASSMAAVVTATESAKAAAKAAFMTKDEILARAARL